MAHTTIIGIDVSKNFADACAISAQGEVMLETKIFYDTVGLQHFLKQLDQLAGEQRHCAVAVMESTAHYHRILETYLRRSGIDVVVINPLQSGSMKNLEIRKIKHNKISKRGSPYLRKILDTCTHVATHKGRNQQPANPILAAYYEEKRSVKPANVAQCACIHKMLGYIFSVLRNQKPFELRSPEEHLALMRSKTADIAA